MRLGTLALDGGSRAVVVRDGRAATVGEYADVGALLRDGEAGLAAARRAHEQADGAHDAAPQRLLRPVLEPGAIVCVGLNYRSHILEMGRELPTAPTLFSKLPRALTDPTAAIELPAVSERIDYEGELAVVIGRAGRDVAAADAWSHVAGLTLMNDVTARDFQRRTLQWFAGKTLQASTPIGPVIVTADELEPLGDRELVTRVNGEECQRAPLSDLVFDVPALVADLSRLVELAPGDVIATGTPGGVGEAARRYLGDGDVVEVSIDGIGTLRNEFRSAR
ncbi:fumarylacetoacetate hydrolase family protein [Conexibacter woesei]|uniref:Fumarylacetoacetate (FAA) hydrolase n=1 Tax=Conexibacter woesei (strain DSM 14684 / CCUG 47730 / CIP 108061 / JCM 11494 / NBRC 100937 / ID131577) TaxID=469383 RepID=D3FAS0_CONWI|nr:fumarylacetoacetate hydrolase family protein [Conexibacter woesei]ADB51233.1 fumarylacetoacetate (FAA) hydrolase [Conexibacter woesei DSM 14684]